MNADKVGINDRVLVVNYPNWEQVIERFKHITDVITDDLNSMGNKQKIASVFIGEKNGKYQIVYTLKPNQ